MGRPTIAAENYASAVPESNAELMRRAFESYNREGWEAMLPWMAQDFELTTPPGLAAEPDTYRGEEGMRRYWESFDEIMEEIRIELKELREIDDWVVAPFRLSARGRTTGIDTGIDAVMAWRWRDGKAVRALLCPTLEEAEAAIPPRD
jgi:ketosteroid isomerase-like protein